MSGINPYAQGGWANPQNPWSVNGLGTAGSGAPLPSVYGALPAAAQPTPAKLVNFQCTGLNPDITNCVIFGPNSRHCYSVTTTPATSLQPSTTYIRNTENDVVAKVEWHQRPVVEATGWLNKQYAAQFLALSQDGHRVMVAKGRPCTVAVGNGGIQMYCSAYSPAELISTVTAVPGAIALKVTQVAIHGGMLEVCVLVAVLMCSGRPIV